MGRMGIFCPLLLWGRSVSPLSGPIFGFMILVALAANVATVDIARAASVFPATESDTIAGNAQDAAPQTSIAIGDDSGRDAAISERIAGIFGAINGLSQISVSVSSGVVTLSGAVADDDTADRANAIAQRIDGVVTVESNLTRSVAVNDNVAPALSQFADDARGIFHALPLIAVAIGLGLVIAFIGYSLAAFGALWRKITPNVFLAELVASFIRFAFAVLGMITALEIIGATALLGAVLGGAGVIGIALGFAVRDTVDNYVSSLMLSLRQPFRANDHVVIDGEEGLVIRLTSRATVLMTLEGNHLRIPNSTVFKAVILNYTTNPDRRFEFKLGVDADDNAVNAMKTGLAAINALPFILANPKAVSIIEDVGDSTIVLSFRGWVDQRETDFYKGRSLAIQAAKDALEQAGFALPEPIYRLRFDQNTPLALQAIQASERASSNGKDGKDGKAAAPHAGSNGPMANEMAQADTHISQLVEEERAASTEKDLLDHKRPVE